MDVAEDFADDPARRVRLTDVRHVAGSPRYSADAAAYNASHPSGLVAACETPHEASRAQGTLEQQHEERICQATLARCIFGDPFHPITLEPSLLTDTVVNLARTIYDERAFDRLPVLADALEEARVTEPDLLNHCRQPSVHARGCWVVDLVLGKT